ncbi:hypothetical protein JCM9279_000976 [Rhodotorula babjevae]
MSSTEPQEPVEEPVEPSFGLQDLPEETLAQIVALVAEQEAEIRSTNLSINQSATHGSVQAKGFSTWYLHGVGALSVVNKKLRRLTLPHLCKLANCAQLAAPIVQFRGIPPELLSGIRTLDLCNATASSFAAAAKMLPRLTGIHTLRADQHTRGAASWHELAVSAFVKVAAKVDTLVLFSVSVARLSLLGRAALLVQPTVLRHLYLYTVDPVFGAASSVLSQVLAEFKDLETLKIFEHDDESASAFDWVRRQPHWLVPPNLASLRTLRLEAADLHVLAFVADLAPNVVHLEIIFASKLVQSNEIETVSLPRLRSLEITGDLSCLLSLGLINLMPVTYLHIRVDHPSTGTIDLEPYLPDRLLLSSALELNFCHKTLVTVKNLSRLVSLCKSQGATYRGWLHGLLEPFSPSLVPAAAEESSDEEEDDTSGAEEGSSSDEEARASPASAYLRQLAFSVLETKHWAYERAIELGAADDVDGLVELAETLRKVEERRILEEL